MNPTIELLRLLADTGEPLNLTISQEDDNIGRHTIHASGRGSVTLRDYQTPQTFIQALRHDLQHYPSPAAINGNGVPVPATPFPGLARATLTRHDEHTVDHPESRPITLVEGASYDAGQNALVAGLLTTLAPPQAFHTYTTPGPAAHPHWQPAHRVTLRPISVVTPEEFHALTDPELQLLINRDPILPLAAALIQQDRDQIDRTLLYPDAPARYQGPIHHYVVSHPSSSKHCAPFVRGEPIIVHRTPVLIEADHLTNAEFISVAEAFYTNPQEFVPVDPEDLPKRKIATPRFQATQADPQASGLLRPSTNITLSFKTDSAPSRTTMDALLWLTADDYELGPGAIHYVPAAADPAHMTEALVRAYWSDHRVTSRDDSIAQFDQHRFDMHCIVKAATNDAVKAYQDQMEEHLQRFSTLVPQPASECSVTSADGHITMTFRPNV